MTGDAQHPSRLMYPNPDGFLQLRGCIVNKVLFNSRVQTITVSDEIYLDDRQLGSAAWLTKKEITLNIFCFTKRCRHACYAFLFRTTSNGGCMEEGKGKKEKDTERKSRA